MTLRALPIRVRVVLAVAVPTIALLLAVGYEVRARQAVAVAARAELHRTEALAAIASVQALNSVPETALVQLRIDRSPQRSPQTDRVVAAYWQVVSSQFLQADEARTALSPAARAEVGDGAMAVFERQRRAVDAVLAAAGAGGRPDRALVDEAVAARRAADVAFADLAVGSASDAWIVYQGAVDAIRLGRIEYANVLPALIGLGPAAPDELAALAGMRANATERVVLALGPGLRSRAAEVLGSDSNDRWSGAVAGAQAVAAGRAGPLTAVEVATLAADAAQLESSIWAIAAEAVAQVRAELTATAELAEAERQRLLVFAGALLAVTSVLTGWILHSITRPLHRLTRRAAAVAAGELDGECFDVGGRDELARLGATIEDVAAGLRHLDRQIQAMTDGHLDDPSLDRPAPGPVGIYVQQRVQQLRKVSGDRQADAERDPLTGVLNRRGLRDAMARSRGRAAPAALIYLDLDRFKAVNDRHGHRHGDTVLKVVAARLAGLVRPDDLVARLGGDEFALVVRGVTLEHMPVFVNRLELGVAEPIAFEDQVHQVGCSIGVSWLEPGDDVDVVVDRADRAMFSVKVARSHPQAG